MGRPSLNYYDFITPDIVEQIPRWKRAGRTDQWIATRIGISTTTMHLWKTEHEEFKRLFKKGREDLLLELEESAYSLARGKFVKEKEYSVDREGNLLDNVIMIKEKFKQDPAILKTVLAQLDPSKWSKTALSGEADPELDEGKIIFGGDDDL